MHNIRGLFVAEWKLRSCAAYVSAAYSTVDGWQWSRWDELVGAEIGGTVHTVRTEMLKTGEITGMALRGEDACRIVIPTSVSLEHQIHIAAHEAWHLIAGHDGCRRHAAHENTAERFAGYVGLSVDRRSTPHDHRWYRTVGAS